MIAYRIADARHPIFDAIGAMLHGGRWNSVGLRAIYAAETYAGALLEILVHANLSQPPKNHRVVRIVVPDTIIETVSIDTVRNWDAEDMIASRAFGDRWIRESRTADGYTPPRCALLSGHRVILPLHRAKLLRRFAGVVQAA